MENDQPPTTCSFCQSPIKYIPAGISRRNNKPYSEFWACNNRDCAFTWRPAKEDKGGNVIGEMISAVIDKRLLKTEEALKIMNDNLTGIAEAINKLLKK